MILQIRRHPMRPAHVHFLVDAPGYEPLITHVFIEGDKYLDSDVVFGVKNELIAKIEKRNDPADAGRQAGARAVAPDDLRIPHEARQGNGPKTDDGGDRGRVKTPVETPAHFLCGAQEMCPAQILDAILGMHKK